MLSQRNHRVRGVLSLPTSVAIWDARWRIRASRRCLMSQRIDGTQSSVAYFPDAVCQSYTLPRRPRRPRPSSWKASDWNAASVRSFVTYDALMKFPDLRCRGVALMNDAARHGDKLWSGCGTTRLGRLDCCTR